MKKLLILSGKGGTGKTTTAAAFIEFSKARAFADCDVDAPNLHLVNSPKVSPSVSSYYGSEKAVIDADKCIGCGACQQHCRFNAIEKIGDKYRVNEYACEGCAVCTLNCKVDAVTMVDDVAGDLILYKDNQVFSSAKLKMGRGTSGKLVAEVKNQLYQNVEKDVSFAIIDGSPGIGCPVIASLSGVDMVLVVAEPSLSGISDMERIIKTAQIFNVGVAVCVNKCDTSLEQTENIVEFCRKNNIEFVGKIPYDKEVSKAINSGMNVAKVDCSASRALKKVYTNVFEHLLA